MLPNTAFELSFEPDFVTVPDVVVVVVPLLVEVEVVPVELVLVVVVIVVLVTVGAVVVVDVVVVVAVGEMIPLTVWQSPVTGSMRVHAGDRETWARETSLPPGRRNRIVTSAKLAASDTWIMARLKRRSLIGRTP